MYTPPHNRQEDPEAISGFIRAFPFATLVTDGEGAIMASHIPLNLLESCDSRVLTGHIAKANPQWGHLANGAEVLAVFSEPHSYVSPSNYEPGNWVPTWNYVAVHAHGTPALIEDREGKLAVLAATIAATEPGYQQTLDAFPPEFVNAKLKGIVAFEIAVTRVDARWKLSQDRSAEERERISLALRLSGDASGRRLAEFMARPAGTVAR
jgi:transcriptional regulator